MRTPLKAYCAMRAEFSLLKTATIGPVNPNRTAYSAVANASAVPLPSSRSLRVPAASFLP